VPVVGEAGEVIAGLALADGDGSLEALLEHHEALAGAAADLAERLAGEPA